MIPRLFWLSVTGAVAATLFYVSRFWDFRLWSRDGLFGIETLRPQGGLLARWLRGTELAPFELILWVIGVFLVLTWLQRIHDALRSRR
ncbi:MAG: hypothetical protein OIF47_00715 [Marinibacterium sp.]|nr:hypothetical protein [Marinibacterium sp.]